MYVYEQTFVNTWTHNNQRNPGIYIKNIKFQPNKTTFRINLIYNLFESLTNQLLPVQEHNTFFIILFTKKV